MPTSNRPTRQKADMYIMASSKRPTFLKKPNKIGQISKTRTGNKVRDFWAKDMLTGDW